MVPEKIKEQYERNVIKKEDPNACWDWAQSTTKGGYPNMLFSLGTVNKKQHQKHYYGHRVSYELHYGIEPGELFVCHSCDNPICTNPRHLWLGTCYDNVHDAINKGRISNNGPTKYTDEYLAEFDRRCREDIFSWKNIANDMDFPQGKALPRARRLAKEQMPKPGPLTYGNRKHEVQAFKPYVKAGLIKSAQVARLLECHPNSVRTWLR